MPSMKGWRRLCGCAGMGCRMIVRKVVGVMMRRDMIGGDGGCMVGRKGSCVMGRGEGLGSRVIFTFLFSRMTHKSFGVPWTSFSFPF